MGDKHLYNASGKYVGRLSDQPPSSCNNDDTTIGDVIAFIVIAPIACIPFVSFLGVIVMAGCILLCWPKKYQATLDRIIFVVVTGSFFFALYSAIWSWSVLSHFLSARYT